MTSPPAPESRRVAALQAALAAGANGALGRFWDEIASGGGAPLIETLPDRQALVTFLWRGAGEGAVVLQSPAGGIDPRANRFEHIAGSDVSHRSYVLPAGTRMQYEIGVAATAEALERGWEALDWSTDPLNRSRHVLPNDPEGTFQGYPVSVLELPGTPEQPWVERREDIATGAVEQRRVAGPRLGESRRIWLYAPAGAPAGLVVLFDGWVYANVIPTPTILDNLIAAGRIPPVAALLVDNPDRRRELTFDERFVEYVADELVPLAREALGAPVDPSTTVAGGSSLGGVAGVFAALRRPDVFGSVLSQSGAFWVKHPRDDAYGWLAREVARHGRLPVRFYLDAGLLEGVPFMPEPSQISANRELRDVLLELGCEVHHAEFAGGHDHLCWRGTLADGLIALLGGR